MATADSLQSKPKKKEEEEENKKGEIPIRPQIHELSAAQKAYKHLVASISK